ncbi:biotin-dependent carboxyltransferase family protein [Vibrio sonorensis]|uniref:5-oxoprolinase subunit C family protein n=1 Tax=Vibrio sonorensis TaxID=1004316 RepID=UPI0008DA91EE|nr:biotin-dependent carboxyltransferase family protein [Vibrio sonorensis]
MNAIKVIKPGQLSLIQDFGRYGLAQYGITQGGPVDDYAYCWANHLLGNEINCPSLEITLGQAEFKILASCQLAIAGGDLNATLDGQPITNWSSFKALKDQVLSFSLPRNGLRSYLAIRGGFNLPSQLGSVSSVAKDKLGGFNAGAAIQSGDLLPFTSHSLDSKSVQLTFRYQPDYNLPLELRVIEGYQRDDFSVASMERFYRSEFVISQHSNRMGYRLEGDSIKPPVDGILSEGIALGSIQVTPEGSPIIMLNDRQTIGGYPKIGCVARIDLPRLAQGKPGQSVTFTKGDLLGLQDVWCQWANFFGY